MSTYKGRLCGIVEGETRLDYLKGYLENEYVSRNIKILQLVYGFSQRDIAEGIGVGQTEISRLMTSSRIPIKTFLDVAEFLNVNPDKLMEVDLAKKVMESL